MTAALDDQASRAAYLAGLRVLARREISTSQLRARLGRGGHPPEAVAAALARLTREGSLDDGRFARAYARTAVKLKRHGPARIRRSLLAAGVDAEIVADAVGHVFADIDVAALLNAALSRRVREGAALDAREMGRLTRALLRLGFRADDVRAALRARRQGRTDSPS